MPNTTPTIRWPRPTRGDWRDQPYLCRSCGAAIDCPLWGGWPLCDGCYADCRAAADSWEPAGTSAHTGRLIAALRRAVGAA